jgi:NAD+ kinase
VEVTAWLNNQDIQTWRGTSEECREHPDVLDDVDLLVALGGDGTVLRAARVAIPRNIPLLTVALGRVNFMAELTPNEIPTGLRALLDGEGWYEQRTLLEATLHRNNAQIGSYIALNEIVLSRGDIGRTLTVDVKVDDIPLTTYRADGVLVATATGSTAYALSAGGPIVDPRARSLLLVPVAAHLTAVPAMVLHEDSMVSLHNTHSYHAMLSVDGRENVEVLEHDDIRVRRSNQVCIFARVHPAQEHYASFVRRLRRE